MKRRTIDWRELGTPHLTAKAIRYLAQRGISVKEAKRRNLRSLPPSVTKRLWGIDEEALLVPFAHDYGTARILWETKFLERKYGKFRSTAGQPTRIYEDPTIDWDEIVENGPGDRELLFIESPIKAIAANCHGLLAIGISGAWNFQRNRVLLRRLREYNLDGATVIPVFDADISENNSVLLAYLLFGDGLQHEGARVKHVRIPMRKGRNQGIDDLIARRGVRAWNDLTRFGWEHPAVTKLRHSVQRTTEGGLAAHFALAHRDEVRYEQVTERFYHFNGFTFVPDSKRSGEIQERMKETVKDIIELANRVKNKERRQHTLRWAMGCDNARSIRGAMQLASSNRDLQISHDHFDRDPNLVGVQNGVLDLRRGRLVDDPKECLVSQRLRVRFDPRAECPRWKRFIRQVMADPDDPKASVDQVRREMRTFLRRMAGYILFGENPHRLLFFLYGVGRNGKSVFIETLLHLMGDYGYATNSRLLMTTRRDRDPEGATPFMFKLQGKRLITASEVGNNMHMDEAVVKSLTGGDKQSFRTLHGMPVEFTVVGKFLIRANRRVIIDGEDQAMWDRVVEIPFNRRFTEAEEDPHLRAKLMDELPGILNWALKGFRSYEKGGGLRVPEKVKGQTRAYRASMNSVQRWLQECTAIVPSGKSEFSMLYEHYCRWCKTQQEKGATTVVETSRSFSESLSKLDNVEKGKRQTWHGLMLVSVATGKA